MKNSFIKPAIAVSVLSSLAIASIAQAESFALAPDDASIKAIVVMNKLSESLSNSTSSISKIEPVLASAANAYIDRMGDDYVPVIFAGRRFMASKNGKQLVEPNSLFVINGEGVVRVSDVLLDLDFEAPLPWPTIPLPGGVEKKADLYVLSDPTCGYCQKLDAETYTYLENGIQVHYVPWPRSGMSKNAPAYQKWAAAVCSEKPGEAYHDISLGKGDKYPVPNDMDAACTDIIEKGYEFGLQIGVSGTPFMYGVTTEGKSFSRPGYMPVKDFAGQLGLLIKDDGLSTIIGQ